MKESAREHLNKIAAILLKDSNETGIAAVINVITQRDKAILNGNSMDKSVLQEICIERLQQDQKWGEQNYPIWVESFHRVYVYSAKMAKRACDEAAKAGRLTWHDILNEEFMEIFAEESPLHQRKELIQVAAVAISMIQYLDRKYPQFIPAKVEYNSDLSIRDNDSSGMTL